MKMKLVGILVALIILGATSIANAGNITVYEDTESMLTHYAETTIAYNESNSPFLAWPAPAIDGYLLDGGTKLSKQSKDINDFIDFYGQLQTTGIQVGEPAWWKCVIDNSDGTLDDKNIIIKIYDKDADVSDSNETPITKFDPFYESAHNEEFFGWFKSGSFAPQTQGVYGQIVYDVKNYSDLNRDKKVNLRDYAIFAENYGRTGVDCGADPNNFDDYSDINRNGVVDYNDLDLFSDEWLWDANDPNTW